MQAARKMAGYLIPMPKPRGLDVRCKLQHFAIITYAVPADRFAGLFLDRFQLDALEITGRS